MISFVTIVTINSCASEAPSGLRNIPDTAQVGVAIENKLAGTADWQLHARAFPDSLAVWASPYDAVSGDTLNIYIHSVHGGVKIGIYRLGWYQGLGGREVTADSLSNAQPQPPCSQPFPGPISCPWTVSLRLPVQANWPGGWYTLRVQDSTGRATAYPFVVRSRQQHQFLAVVPQFTWQAYNSFGGSSLYIYDPATNRVVPVVSFARPYSNDDASGGTMGGTYDLLAMRWLERSGADVGYASDLDLAGLTTRVPEPTKGLIFLGHDEYWTWAERSNVEAFRDAGKHLMFLAANNAYWNARSTAGPVTGREGELLTSYKGLPDPGAVTTEQTTVRFRDHPLNRPENELYGIMFDGMIHSQNSAPHIGAPDSAQGPEAAAFLAAAGLGAGDSLGSPTSHEGDDVAANGQGPSGLQTLLTATYQVSATTVEVHRTTFFIAPSGAGVFASGSNLWTYFFEGPAYNPRVGEITGAALRWMAAH